jgi:hypothetical protein
MEIQDILLEQEGDNNMEYIAIGIIKEEESQLTSKLKKCSNDYDLLLIKQGFSNIDIEVQDGVFSFLGHFNLSLFKIIKLSSSGENLTSSDVSQNLINYFLHQEKCKLIEFLIANKDLLPKKYYLVFAFEWHKGELCRYKKIGRSDLSNYFINNNSWYLWLYDFAKNYEKPNMDVPLVLEIDND